MSNLKSDERGVSPVEIVLIVVIVAIIGFVGWFVYHATQSSNNTLSQAASTSQNAGPRFKSTKAKPKTSTSSTSTTTTKSTSQ